LDDTVENRLQIEGRSADDLQHLRGRGLLLQRLREIVGALAQFVEQPRVLDGDDGLGGEVLDQFDLLVREWLHLGTTDCEHTDGLVLPQQRDGQNRPVAEAKRDFAAIWEFVSGCLKIVDVDWRTIDEGASSNRPASDRNFRDRTLDRNRAM